MRHSTGFTSVLYYFDNTKAIVVLKLVLFEYIDHEQNPYTNLKDLLLYAILLTLAKGAGDEDVLIGEVLCCTSRGSHRLVSVTYPYIHPFTGYQP